MSQTNKKVKHLYRTSWPDTSSGTVDGGLYFIRRMVNGQPRLSLYRGDGQTLVPVKPEEIDDIDNFVTHPELALVSGRVDLVSDKADAAWIMSRGGGTWLAPERTLEQAIASVPLAMRSEGFKIDYRPLQSQSWEVEVLESAQGDGEVGLRVLDTGYSIYVSTGDPVQDIASRLASELSSEQIGTGTIYTWLSNRKVLIRIDDSDAAYPVTALDDNKASLDIQCTGPYMDGLTYTFQYHGSDLDGWSHTENWERVLGESEWN